MENLKEEFDQLAKLAGVIEEANLVTEKKDTPDDSIRRGYYSMSDGMYALEDAIKSLGDKKLLTLWNAIKKSNSALYKYLDKNYNWD